MLREKGPAVPGKAFFIEASGISRQVRPRTVLRCWNQRYTEMCFGQMMLRLKKDLHNGKGCREQFPQGGGFSVDHQCCYVDHRYIDECFVERWIFQLAKGRWPDMAPKVFAEHEDSFCNVLELRCKKENHFLHLCYLQSKTRETHLTRTHVHRGCLSSAEHLKNILSHWGRDVKEQFAHIGKNYHRTPIFPYIFQNWQD